MKRAARGREKAMREAVQARNLRQEKEELEAEQEQSRRLIRELREEVEHSKLEAKKCAPPRTAPLAIAAADD